MKRNPSTRGASALTSIALTALALSSFAAVAAADPPTPEPGGNPPEIKPIKAYCIDFLPEVVKLGHQEGMKVFGYFTITTPYSKGRATLTRNGAQWPASVTIRLQKNKGESATAKSFLLANGKTGFCTTVDGTNQVTSGEMEGGLDLGRAWGDKFPLNPASKEPLKVSVNRSVEAIEIVVPPEITKSNPQVLAFEWN